MREIETPASGMDPADILRRSVETASFVRPATPEATKADKRGSRMLFGVGFAFLVAAVVVGVVGFASIRANGVATPKSAGAAGGPSAVTVVPFAVTAQTTSVDPAASASAGSDIEVDDVPSSGKTPGVRLAPSQKKPVRPKFLHTPD